MKTHLLTLILLLTSFGVFAQRSGNLTIYSNTGKKFFVVLNGVRQNEQAQTNVAISGLKEPWYRCRIIAEDNSFDLEKNVGVKKDSTITYRVIKKRRKYKLRYFAEASNGNYQRPNDQIQITYHEKEEILSNDDSGNGSIEINVNNNQTNTNQTTTTTTTTTTVNGNTVHEETTVVTETQTSNNTTYFEDEDMTVSIEGGCSISDEQFEVLLVRIENESFSDDKLTMALAAVKSTCFTVAQIRALADQFSFSDNKMTLIKDAYLNCLNQSDYLELKSAFSFSSDQEELEKFIESKK